MEKREAREAGYDSPSFTRYFHSLPSVPLAGRFFWGTRDWVTSLMQKLDAYLECFPTTEALEKTMGSVERNLSGKSLKRSLNIFHWNVLGGGSLVWGGGGILDSRNFLAMIGGCLRGLIIFFWFFWGNFQYWDIYRNIWRYLWRNLSREIFCLRIIQYWLE